MTATLFSSGPLLTPQGLEQELALIADGDRIAWIGASGKAPPADHAVDLAGRILIPGFIDLQVNGGGGVLFNDTPSPEGLAAIARAHHRFGTTAMLPTLISDSLDVVAAGIAAVDEAIARRTPGVIGIHIEGPYLNPSRKGIHDDSLFVRPNLGDIQRLCTLTSGSTMVTLAPEMVPVGFIAALAERGVRVSAGHTEATYAQIAEALTSGLTGFTHLFNAMPPMLNRTPGTLGAALEDQTAWCGLIVDGIHVDPAVLRIALNCRPRDRFVLVTDAMPVVGSVNNHFRLNGMEIDVRDGRCLGPADTLAGSTLDMASAVRNSMQMLGLDLPSAVAMATANPAAFLGLDHLVGRLATGLKANLVIADRDIRVSQTWIDGACVFSA